MNQNYDNQTWRGKELQDARATLKSGNVTLDQVELAALGLNKQDRAEYMADAQEQMESEMVIAQARAAIDNFMHDLSVYEKSLTVGELNILSQATAQIEQPSAAYLDAAAQNLAGGGVGVDSMLATGVFLTRPARALGEKIIEASGNASPRVKVLILSLVFMIVLYACAPPGTNIETVVASGTTPVAAAPANTEIPVSSPTANIPPTQAPIRIPTEMPTQIPTEVPIPSFMNDFIARGWDKQFENPDRGVNMCYIDPNSLRQTDFWVGDVHILGVFDCYFIDDQNHLQQISVPMAWDKPTEEYHYGNWGNNKQKGDFSPGYMWNQAKDNMVARFKLGLNYFQFGNSNEFDPAQDPWLKNYWQAAITSIPYLDENFRFHGQVNLSNQPNANHFMIPTNVNFK